MEWFKYMTVPRKMLLQAVIDELNLECLIKNENILVKIKNEHPPQERQVYIHMPNTRSTQVQNGANYMFSHQ